MARKGNKGVNIVIDKQERRCFVISPIGESDSEVRKRADQIYDYVIKPIMIEKSYEVTRSDYISVPGDIPNQILQHLLLDKLVVADLTLSNPNVTYELGIRHMTQKPVIQIMDTSSKLPFDLFGVRTIPVDYRFISSMDECKEKMSKQIDAIDTNPEQIHSPIADAMLYAKLITSDNPSAKVIANLQSEIDSIKSEMAAIKKNALSQTLGNQWTLPKFTLLESGTSSSIDPQTIAEAFKYLNDKSPSFSDNDLSLQSSDLAKDLRIGKQRDNDVTKE